MVNVKSAMARFGLGPPPPPDSGNEVEYIAWFRFPVTWTYLDSTAADAAPVPIKPLAPAAAVMTLVSTASAAPAPAPIVLDTSIIAGEARSAAAAQWEMVIPKMTRPPGKPVVDRLSEAPPLPAIAPPVNDTAPVEYVPPSLSQVVPEGTFLARFWRQLALAAVAILVLAWLLWGTSGGDDSRRNTPTWSHRYTSPPGRLLSLYEPSHGESDYSIEFAWVPDAKGAGLVLRARDENNYYATRLTLQQPAPNLELAEEHFTVLGGVEGAHSRKVISLKNSGTLQIQMDAIGSAFTLSVQGRPVDYWNDTQLNAGTLGFYDETGDRPDVHGLHVTLIKKGATRTAVASLP